MKRFLCLLFIVLLIPVFAFSDSIKLSTLSDADLEHLRLAVQAEILSRSQWESVTVPVGYYIVGEDIPAGHWTIKYSPGEYSLFEYFLNADETGMRPADVFSDYYYDGISDPDSSMADVYRLREIDLDLKKGYHVVINYGSVIFEPFTGRTSPFFP